VKRNIQSDDIEHFAGLDSVDKEIVQRLLEVGVDGALPKDLAFEVNNRNGYSLKYYDVARRLVRLNKKLNFETGKVLFEKQGKRWTLTHIGFSIYAAKEPAEDSSVDAIVEDSEDE
jgi:hypothetical protein